MNTCQICGWTYRLREFNHCPFFCFNQDLHRARRSDYQRFVNYPEKLRVVAGFTAPGQVGVTFHIVTPKLLKVRH